MSGILAITFPIYAAIAIGYLIVTAGWFTQAHMRVLGNYVLNIALPALLFNAVASRDLAEVFHPGYMLVFALGGLATIALAYVWFTLTRTEAPRRAVAVMGTACPNSGFIGYPVMLLTFPDLAGIILALNMLVENILLIPICLILMDLAHASTGHSIVKRIGKILWSVLKRPMILGLLVGLLISVLQVPVPEPVTRLMEMLAASASALSLVVIGGSLAGLSLRGNLARALQIATGKMIVHPMLTALTVTAISAFGFGLTPDMRMAAILSAAMPMFGIYVVLAQDHGHEGMASIAMLVATTLGFATLTVLLSSAV